MKLSLRKLFWLVLAGGGALWLPLHADGESAESAASVELGERKQLFFDDYLVASSTNVSRQVHRAEKLASNPVIRQTEPWEDAFNIMATIAPALICGASRPARSSFAARKWLTRCSITSHRALATACIRRSQLTFA